MMKQLIVLMLLGSLSSTCKPRQSESEVTQSKNFEPPYPSKPRLCAAVRGNGTRIYSHFGSLARIVENYGLVEGMIGGSSGAVVTFVYESIYSNPAVWSCRNGACTDDQKSKRAALLLKSLLPFTHLVSERPGLLGIEQVKSFTGKLKKLGIQAALNLGDVGKSAKAVREILSSSELSGLVNRTLMTKLFSTKKEEQKFALQQIISFVKSGAWDTSSANIFMIQPLIDFDAAASKLAALADLYAGVDSVDDTKAFLDECSELAVGKDWKDFKGHGQVHRLMTERDGTTGKTYNCGDFFSFLATRFLDKKFPSTGLRKPLDEVDMVASTRGEHEVGKFLPSLVMTSVVYGSDTNKLVQSAYKEYRAHGPLKRPLGVPFSKVRSGFWGQESVLAKADPYNTGAPHLFSQHFLSLGQARWKNVLLVGGQEPGLGGMRCQDDSKGFTNKRYVNLEDFYTVAHQNSCVNATAGGWFNHFTMTELKKIGCEKVIYLTSWEDGSDKTYVRDVARQLGATEPQIQDFFGVKSSRSAAVKALADADAIWCTNWNTIDDTKFEALMNDGYHSASLVSEDDFFLTKLAQTGIKALPRRELVKPLLGCQVPN